MTNDEAMQLAKQGFTADEIRALGWSVQSPSNNGKDETEPKTNEKDGGTEPKTNEEDNKTSDVTETLKALTDTVSSLSQTVKAMQESNQKNAKRPKNDNVPKSADEVVKGFIESM